MIDSWEEDQQEFGIDEDDCTSDMAMGQVHRLHDLASELEKIVGDTENLPDWVKYKITSAMGDLEDVYNYMEPQHHHDVGDVGFEDEMSVNLGDNPTMVEGKKKKRGLWANIHAKRKRGEKAARPGEKGYPDSKTWKKLTSGYEPEGEDLLREMIQSIVEKKCKGYKKSPVGSPRQRSFCRRMCGMRKKNTGAATAKDPDSCINQSLRRWRCRCS